jgi:hypothetical protein
MASILSLEVNFTFVGIKQRNASAGGGYLPFHILIAIALALLLQL